MLLNEQDEIYIRQIGASIKAARYDAARYLLHRKPQVEHGYFTMLKEAVAGAFEDAGVGNIERYMRVVKELDIPDTPPASLNALTALTRAPEPVKRLALSENVQGASAVKLLEKAYKMRDVDSTWQELVDSRHLQWDDNAVHLGDVTGRDVKQFELARRWAESLPPVLGKIRTYAANQIVIDIDEPLPEGLDGQNVKIVLGKLTT